MNAQALTTNAPSSPIAQAERLLLSVLEKMEKLTVLFTQELDSLTANDMSKFQEIQPEKIRLIRDCESGVAEIEAKKETIALCNPVLKERLISSHAVLSDMAVQSKRACEARARSVKRIQNRLLQAARMMVNKDKKNYGRNGKIETSPKNRPVATAINEAI
ncbi:MAG TPA: hypothetical protein PKI93_08195 [Alphaproteobacteria bacterium]|nr:hypothetical protein [Alphaproteobacteria bacterium]HNS44091.1 hypothetical protein [Alphaproteobacteria bacterium]